MTIGILELDDPFGHVRVGALRGQHADQPPGAAEHLLPDAEDLDRAVRRETPAGLPRLVGKAQLLALLAGPAALLELAVPDFVGILDVHLSLRFQPLLDQLGEPPHEIVVGQMRDAKPGVGVQTIGQIDHDFQGHALFRERRVVGRRPVRPVAELRAVGVHPVHEPQASHALPPLQEHRMERILLVRLLKTRHDHANVAHVVGRVGLAQLQKETAFGRVDVDHHPARFAGHDAGGVDELQPALAIVQHGVASAGIMSGFDGTQRRFGPAIRLQPRHPAVFIQRQLRALAPRGALPLADPGPRQAEHVHKRQFGIPVRRPVQVHPQPRLSRRHGGRGRWQGP